MHQKKPIPSADSRRRGKPNHRDVTARNGFTLLEIMIAVLVIGLLAAIAIPVVRNVRRTAMETIVDNDARVLAMAAQDWFLSAGNAEFDFNYFRRTGDIRSSQHWFSEERSAFNPLADGISANYTSINGVSTEGQSHWSRRIVLEVDEYFSMDHEGLRYDDGALRWYTPEGQFAAIAEDNPDGD